MPEPAPAVPCQAHPPVEPDPPDVVRAPPPAPAPAGPFALTAPEASVPGGPRYRVPWAVLLRKVFAVDVLDCPRCHGRLQVIAYIAEPTVARRILDHLGLDSQGPPIAKARGPDDAPREDPGPDYSVGDPIFDE